MKNPLLVSFITENKGEKQINGGWKVISTLIETVTYEDGTTDKEELSAMCYDGDFVTAQQIALSSALMQYREEVLDAGFGSLIQAREAKSDTPKVDADTPTQ